MTYSLRVKMTAEFLGTMVLVLFGCGSAVLGGGVGSVGIAFAFGLSLMAMVYSIGHISGCHINPAVTITMWALGKIQPKDVPGYILSQIAGAITGAVILYTIANGNNSFSIANGLGQNFISHKEGGYSLISAILTEVVFTFIFILVILASTSVHNSNKYMQGLAIGLILTVIHVVAIPVTGVSLNPARSIGPAILVGGDALKDLWVFITAPISGGILAAGVWNEFERSTRKK